MDRLGHSVWSLVFREPADITLPHQPFTTRHLLTYETNCAMAFRIKIINHSTNFEPTTGPPICSVCGKAGGSKCGRCNANIYCSTSCQKQDWEYHRLVCSSYAIATDEKRPDSACFRALCKCSFLFWLSRRKNSAVERVEPLGRGRYGHMYLHAVRQGFHRTRPSLFGSG